MIGGTVDGSTDLETFAGDFDEEANPLTAVNVERSSSLVFNAGLTSPPLEEMDVLGESRLSEVMAVEPVGELLKCADPKAPGCVNADVESIVVVGFAGFEDVWVSLFVPGAGDEEDAAEALEPEPSSAWATPVPLASTAPMPRVMAPAPSHAYASGRRWTRPPAPSHA